MARTKKAFVAKRHRCWFSRNPVYAEMSVWEVFQKDPEYIVWCFENLKHLKFDGHLTGPINEYKNKKNRAR